VIQRCTRCERLSCRCASCPVCGRSAAYRGLERVYCADPLCANFPWRVSEANEVRQRIETLAKLVKHTGSWHARASVRHDLYELLRGARDLGLVA